MMLFNKIYKLMIILKIIINKKWKIMKIILTI